MSFSKKRKIVAKKRQNVKNYNSFLLFIIIALSLIIPIILELFGADIFFEIGKVSFDKKDFQTASKYFERSHQLKKDNQKYSYFYTLSLAKSPFTYEVQQKLYSIAGMGENSKSGKLAVSALRVFKRRVLKNVGENYIALVLNDGQVLRWSLASMPLKYYVGSKIYVPQYFYDSLDKSFMDWQIRSNSLVGFQKTSNRDDAQIVVDFVDIDASEACRGFRCEYSVGNTKPEINSGHLEKMNILINVKNNAKSYFSQDEIATTMTHEIGHSLGLWGHSQNPNDIMFYFSTDYGWYNDQKQISSRDLGTLRLLYYLAPDISNVEASYSDREKMGLKSIFLADDFTGKTAISSNFVLNSSNVNDWIELATKHAQNGDYEKSVEILNRAFKFSTDKQTSAILYFDIANSYYFAKKYPEALLNAQKSLELNFDFSTRLMIAVIKSKMGDFSGSKSELEELLSEQPQNIDASVALADNYMSKYDFLSARKVIKKLIKNNHDAINDKKLTKYKFFIAF